LGLVTQLHGHTGDVRGLCRIDCLEEGCVGFVSGSRDRLAKIWKSRDGGKNFEEYKSVFDHEHWVSAVVKVDGGFVTASQDHTVRWFDTEGNLISKAKEHAGPVTALSWCASTGVLVSGSWDGTARRWSLDPINRTMSCQFVYDGHENGCAVLACENGDVVTGSAGLQHGNSIQGSQIRIFRKDKLLRSSSAHTGAIRSLCATSTGFASASNDGTVKIWSEDGEVLSTFSNPPAPEGAAFNFCVSRLGTSCLAVACDDCCVRVWDMDTGKSEEVVHPCTVWFVCELNNGDLVTAGSDGVARVFSRDSGRQADPTVQDHYQDITMQARTAIANKQSNSGNKIDATKLPKIFSAQPGTSDGQVKMFNKDGVAWVYSWSQSSGTWIEVGEVMGDAGKEELDGEAFDKVIPVELEDPASGGLRKLKIGFNNGDNPYNVAREFVHKHDLDENHVQEIAEFISRVRGNSSTPMIDMSGGNSGGTAPMDVDSGNATPIDCPFPLPSVTGLAFETVNAAKAFDKLKTFEQVPAGDLTTISSLVGILENTSRYHSSVVGKEGVETLGNALDTYSQDTIFPVLDIIRMLLVHPDGARTIANSRPHLLKQVLDFGATDGAPLAVVLLAARVGANLFRQRAGADNGVKALVGGDGLSIVKDLKDLAGFPNKNVRSAVATCLCNCSNALVHALKNKGTSDVRGVRDELVLTCCALAETCIESNEVESVRRCVVGVGCLCLLDSSLPDSLQTPISSMLSNANRVKNEEVEKAVQHVELVTKSKHK